MLEKRLAVIGSQCERTPVPEIHIDKIFGESSDLLVGPTYTSVVEPDDLLAFLCQPPWGQVFTVPIGVQIARLRRSSSSVLHEFQRFRRRKVRRVRIHQVQPEEERPSCIVLYPGAGVINDYLGRWKFAQCIQRLRTAARILAILEIQFVVSSA